MEITEGTLFKMMNVCNQTPLSLSPSQRLRCQPPRSGRSQPCSSPSPCLGNRQSLLSPPISFFFVPLTLPPVLSPLPLCTSALSLHLSILALSHALSALPVSHLPHASAFQQNPHSLKFAHHGPAFLPSHGVITPWTILHDCESTLRPLNQASALCLSPP